MNYLPGRTEIALSAPFVVARRHIVAAACPHVGRRAASRIPALPGDFTGLNCGLDPWLLHGFWWNHSPLALWQSADRPIALVKCEDGIDRGHFELVRHKHLLS